VAAAWDKKWPLCVPVRTRGPSAAGREVGFFISIRSGDHPAEYLRKSFIKESRLPPKKVMTIYQGVDLDSFSAGAPPKSPVVGIVARLDPVKGHVFDRGDYLLKAV